MSFALSPDLEQGLLNLLAWQFAECERKCVWREKKKHTEKEREIESFQLQATGSEHPGLASLASHAFSYDISKLVTQLFNWREKLS